MAAKVCGCGNDKCTKVLTNVDPRDGEDCRMHSDWHVVSEDCIETLPPNAKLERKGNKYNIYSWKDAKKITQE